MFDDIIVISAYFIWAFVLFYRLQSLLKLYCITWRKIMRVDYSDVAAVKRDLMEMLDERDLGWIVEHFDEAHELHSHFENEFHLYEYIDGMVDIYNYDLRIWAVDQWAVGGGCRGSGTVCLGSDYHKMIMAGQYQYYSHAAMEAIWELFDDINKKKVA